MQFRKLIFVLTITTTVIFGLLMGSSYAYYVSSDGTTLNVTTGSFDGGLAIVFNQNEYINTVTGVPILASDVESLASKTVFTLAPDKTILDGYDVSINVNLVDIEIDDELKTDDFKFKLMCDGTNLESKTGSDVGDKTSLLMGTLSTEDGNFSTTKLTTCNLYVWLEESGADQNELMNRHFSGLVKIETAFRK